MTTVAEVAKQLKIPVDRLMAQLAEAGINVQDTGDELSPAQKVALTKHMAAKKTGGNKKLSLKDSKTGSKTSSNAKPVEKKNAAEGGAKKPRSSSTKKSGEKKLSPLEIAKQMAEQQRLAQGEA